MKTRLANLIRSFSIISVLILSACSSGGGSSSSSAPQPPPIEPFSKTYGSATGSEQTFDIKPTKDGGYVLAGYISMLGNTDAWVAKLDAKGNVVWLKSYGAATYQEDATEIEALSDGGYVVAGRIRATKYDSWVAKLDANGDVIWLKTYGELGSDEIIAAIHTTSDGGYVLAGNYMSSTPYDAWVAKLDASGNVSWQKTYGAAPSEEIAYDVKQTSDGGYVVAGRTNFCGGNDAWVAKLDSGGNVTWLNAYGSLASAETASSIVETNDGGYVVTGYMDTGDFDSWVAKLDAVGDVTWLKVYGGTMGDEIANRILPTSDGGFVISGSYLPQLTSREAWVAKLDASGAAIWSKFYGGAGSDSVNAILATSDGGYVMAGRTATAGAGSNDVWVMKLDSNGNIPLNSAASGMRIQNTTTTVTSLAVSPVSLAVSGVNLSLPVSSLITTTVDASATIETQTAPSGVLTAPDNLLATAVAPDGIDISWSDNSDNETGYILFRSADNVTFTRLHTVASNVINYTDTGLSSGVTYFYKVEAYNAAGYSDFSSVVSAMAP